MHLPRFWKGNNKSYESGRLSKKIGSDLCLITVTMDHAALSPAALLSPEQRKQEAKEDLDAALHAAAPLHAHRQAMKRKLRCNLTQPTQHQKSLNIFDVIYLRQTHF
jgi:hypothetical protein